MDSPNPSGPIGMGATPVEGLYYDDAEGLRFLLTNNKVQQVIVSIENVYRGSGWQVRWSVTRD